MWSGERRLVTILFADLASFTATSEDADPEDVIDMLNQVFSRLMVEYDREEGYLDKTVGDQLMVLFGAPRAHEDDPVRAVRAALGMQAAMEELAPVMREKVGAACKLNIGINTGVVVWGRMGPSGRAAPTVIGDDVNLASRLEQFATGGQVVVSDPVYFLTRRFFEYEVLEPIQVKGKSKPIPVYLPLGPRRSVRSARQSAETATPMLARNHELQALQAHWASAIAGHKQFVLLLGEAGLGKSRLVGEFIHDFDTYSVDKKPLVLQAQGESVSGGSYLPLVDLLSQLFNLTPNDSDMIRRRKVEDRAEILGITHRNFVPLMGYLLGWYQDDDRLLNAGNTLDHLRKSAIDSAAALLLKQSTRRPTLLMIEDLQWADTNTLEWLKRMGAIMQAMPDDQVGYSLMLLVASRPQLDISTDSLHADNVITLEPLSEAARRDLIRHLLPGGSLPTSLVERLIQESGGNPFYLEEAARGLVQSEQLVRKEGAWHLTRPVDQIYVPHSVEGLVMAHLDVLDRVARIVLQHASVIGLHFGYGLLAAITPVDDIDPPLADLEQRGLIKEIPSPGVSRTFVFTQMIVREVAYRSLLRKTRRDLHEQIASLTEAESGAKTQENLETLAYHYTAVGHGEKVVAYNWLAGQRALDMFDFETAHRHLDLASSALREGVDPNPETYRNVTSALGDASTFIGDFDQAAACYELVSNLIGDNPEELAMLHYKIGRLYFYQDNIEAAFVNYQKVIEFAPNHPTLVPQVDAEMRLLYDLG